MSGSPDSEKLAAYELSLESGFSLASGELKRKQAKRGGQISEDAVDEVLDKVFDPILDQYSELGDEELLPRLTKVALRVREAFLGSVKSSKLETKTEDLIALEADPWIAEKRKQIVEMLARFASELDLAGNIRKKIDSEKQIELQAGLVEKLMPLAGDIDEKRLFYLDLNERLDALVKLINELEDFKNNPPNDEEEIEKLSTSFDLRKEALSDLLLSLNIDSNIGVHSLKRTKELFDDFNEKIKKYENLGQELRSKMKDFGTEWGLDLYKNKFEHKDVDEMTPTEIIDYVIANEIPFWEPLHLESDDDFVRKLVFRLKYNLPEKGQGWEQNTSREGTGNDYWATLEGRENMVRMQIFAVQAWVLRGKPYAEGDRTKLFEALDKFKLSREQLILATTENLNYGKYLSKVLEICQDLPILREGKIPKEADLTADDRAQLSSRLTAVGGDYKQLKPLNDRVVIRNGKELMLAGDRYIHVKDENTGQVLQHQFHAGEEALPTDKPYIDCDPKFNYVSLSGNLGKEVAKLMQKKVMQDIASDPERFGLQRSDVPTDEDQLDKVGFFGQMLFYSFPFLTYILSKSQERTQTASHGKDLDDKYDWGLIFSPLGKAIHESDRYGDFVSWMWLLIYYEKLRDGAFGAGGDTKRLNEFRELLIAHQRALFGNRVDDYVGKIGLLNTFGESEFTSPHRMLTLAPTECVRLMGSAKTNDGRVIPPNVSVDNPYHIGPGGKQLDKERDKIDPAHSFDLLQVAISGWVKLLQSVVEEIPVDSVTSENMRSKGKSKGLLGDIFAIVAGTLKMWETGFQNRKGTDLEKFNALQGFAQYAILHKIDRLFHAAKSEMIADRLKMFQATETQIMHASGLTGGGGGLSSGPSQQMALWILDKVRGNDSGGKKYGKSTGLFGTGFEGMRTTFAPKEKFGNSTKKDFIIDYLELLWNWMSKTSDGNVLGPFPLSKKSDSVVGFKTPRALTSEVRLSPEKDEINRFSSMAMHPETLEPPLLRIGLETSSSKGDK